MPATVTHDIVNSRVDFDASAGAGESFAATLTWGETLPAGRYTLGAGLTATLSGTGNAYVSADPIDGAVDRDRSIAIIGSGSTTLAVQFIMPQPFKLTFGFAASSPSGSATGTLDGVTLSRLDSVAGSGEFDQVSLDDVSGSAVVGGVFRDGDTIAEAVSYMLSAVTGWYYVDARGAIAFGRLTDVDTAPIFGTIPTSRLASLPDIGLDPAQRLSNRWAGGRNWRPYTDAELAGITYPDRPPFTAENKHTVTASASPRYASHYTHAIGAEPVQTSLHARADVQAEADRVAAFYTRPRRIIECAYIADSEAVAATIAPGLVMQLDAAEFGELQGSRGLIIGVAGNFRTRVVTLTMWA